MQGADGKNSKSNYCLFQKSVNKFEKIKLQWTNLQMKWAIAYLPPPWLRHCM